jgi:tetratricopeptide (TPR) repeat protein
MRRIFLITALVLAWAGPARGQIGKQPIVRAGSSEDKALSEIDAVSDPARKQELLEKFLGEFGQTDLALLAYDRYIALYLAEKNYDKAFAYGEKALALDPDNFGAALNLLRGALEQGDADKAFAYGDRLGAILERYKASRPPEGAPDASWEERKRWTLESLKDQIRYVHATLFRLAYQAPDPPAQASRLERYARAFPDSPYRSAANLGMLILLADYWSERGEQLDKAEEYARKALDLAPRAQKPGEFSEEQWSQQKALQQGLAYSALGEVQIRQGRNTQAVESLRSAAPLLKADPVSYARNQYRLGFALLNLKRISEARAALTEAASINGPYRAVAQEKLKSLPSAPAKKRP